jgi:CRP-like cAMP-binding protein
MNLSELKTNSSLLRNLDDEGFAFLQSVSVGVEFAPGTLIFDEGEHARIFYLVVTGKVGLEVSPPAGPAVLLETLGPGEMLGVSWLTDPYRWNWRARSLALSTLVGFDADAVRARCEFDTNMALSVYETVATEALRRLHATRIRLLDLYPGGPQ